MRREPRSSGFPDGFGRSTLAVAAAAFAAFATGGCSGADGECVPDRVHACESAAAWPRETEQRRTRDRNQPGSGSGSEVRIRGPVPSSGRIAVLPAKERPRLVEADELDVGEEPVAGDRVA